MRSKKYLWMAVVLTLLVGPVASWLGTGARAQADNSINGIVYDLNGKAYPNVTLVFTSEENGRSFTITTDEHGHYHTPQIGAGTYDIDVKDKGQVVFKTGVKPRGALLGEMEDAALAIDLLSKSACLESQHSQY